MTSTKSGQVLDAKQTAYAREVERLLAQTDPTEPPMPGAYIPYAMAQHFTPRECVARGTKLAL